MKIKRILIRYWWFIFLLIIAGFYFFTNIEAGTIKSKEHTFAISNPESITRIHIHNNEISISLEKLDDMWYVNQSYQANRDAINALLTVVSRIRPATPVPLSVNDSLISVIEDEGISISIFSNRRAIKEYSVLSTEILGLGSVGYLSKATKAFKLELPNFSGSIYDLFNTDLAYWHSTEFGIVNPSELLAVEVELPNTPEESFRIDVLDNGEYRLYAIYFGSKPQSYNIDNVNRFMYYLSVLSEGIRVADISPDNKAAILLSEPDYIFTFYLTNNKKSSLTIYPIPIEEYLDEFGRPVKYDLNRIYAKLSTNNHLYEVNYIDFFPILRDFSHFSAN